MRDKCDENVPNPATRGDIFEPRNDPRNVGKCYFSSPQRCPPPNKFLFSTPPTRTKTPHTCLSQPHGGYCLRTYINWWVRRKDRKFWTIDIHRFKKTHNTCRTGSVSGWSTLSVKCRVSIHNPVGGTGRLMDEISKPFGEAVFVRKVSRLVLTCTCLRRAWHEALSCPVWIESHV
jgi:hypothetical protein